MNIKRQYIVMIITLFTILCVEIFFSQSVVNAKSNFNRNIRIGVILPLTGPAADIGNHSFNALKMAIDQINDNGGIKSLGGKQLMLDVSDFGNDPTRLIESLYRFESAGVPLVIGTGTSSGTMLAVRYLDKFNMPLIDCFSTISQYELEQSPYVFSLIGKPKAFADGLDKFVLGKGVIFVHDNSEWNLEIKNLMRAQPNIKIVDEISIPYAQEEILSRIVHTLQENQNTILVQATDPQFTNIMANMFDKIGFQPFGWISLTPGFNNIPQYLGHSTATNGMLIASCYTNTLPIAGNRTFTRNYRSKYGMLPNDVAGMHWNCAWLIKDVLERAGSVDRRLVYEALRQTDIEIGQNNIFLGSGIKFDSIGRNIRHTPSFIQIQKGGIGLVWPEQYKQNQFIPFSSK